MEKTTTTTHQIKKVEENSTFSMDQMNSWSLKKFERKENLQQNAFFDFWNILCILCFITVLFIQYYQYNFLTRNKKK